MKFKTKEQEKAYESAMKRDYKAAAFDVDGTLTEFGKFTIPDYVLETLEKVPLDVPLALCTGRPIDFIHGKMDKICNATRNPEEQRRRWWILAENGGAGYYYEPQSEGYVKFFEAPWPSEEIKMEVLEAHLKDKLGWKIQTILRDHTVLVLYSKWMYLFPRVIKSTSLRNSRKIERLLKKRGLDHLLSVQNSGLGTLIIPKTSGKGQAIQKMARKLGIPMKSILCLGDNPQRGGNDEDFLSGDYGTPFSVGPILKKTYPLPVLNEAHVHMSGPKGVVYLLKKLFHI